MDFEAQQRLQSELSSGERLLWAGRPRQGLRLRAADALMIPFSLLWGGFAVFWEASVLRRGAPVLFALWGVPFVLMGIYITIGRFFVDSYNRARTFYGLTNQRALIRTSGGVKSLSLKSQSEVSLKESSDGSGTISFGSGDSRYGFFAGSGWPGAGRYLPPQFEMIEGARQVYGQVRDTQRSLEQIGA